TSRLRSLRSLAGPWVGPSVEPSAWHEFFVRGKEARHAAAVRVVPLPGWSLSDPVAAGALGRTDFPHVSRGADGELSGDAGAGVGAVQRLAGGVERVGGAAETATGRLHTLAGTR